MGIGPQERFSSGRLTSASRKALGAFLPVAVCLPFLFNFVAWTTSSFDRVQQLRRYGEDMSVATSLYLERRSPTGAPPIKLSSEAAKQYGRELQARMLATEQALGLRPWQFWRTLPGDLPPLPGRVVYRSHDDVGLGRLAGLGGRR